MAPYCILSLSSITYHLLLHMLLITCHLSLVTLLLVPGVIKLFKYSIWSHNAVSCSNTGCFAFGTWCHKAVQIENMSLHTGVHWVTIQPENPKSSNLDVMS